MDIAEQLVTSGQRVDALFSSLACRALSTADIFATELHLPVQIDRRVYEAGVVALQKLVRGLDDCDSAVALVGHNPAFSAFLRYLTEEPYADLPTAGIAVIDLPLMSWRYTFAGKGFLKTGFSPGRDEIGLRGAASPLNWAGRFRLWRIEHARQIFLTTIFILATLLILGVVALIMHQSINPAAMPQ
jgi:phosphohistidine phosphatase